DVPRALGANTAHPTATQYVSVIMNQPTKTPRKVMSQEFKLVRTAWETRSLGPTGPSSVPLSRTMILSAVLDEPLSESCAPPAGRNFCSRTARAPEPHSYRKSTPRL